ncbi:MAG TPA: peptidyl-prolyl cis-trans isomerase [Armatimonadota bacterium]|nr:peptidyl-prolyl cis-trans isomerase [Armatimonadota bacterium]
MRRSYSVILACSGLFIGFLCGAIVTTAYSDQIKFNYDQVIAQIGGTQITRGQLAEQTIKLDGARLLNGDLQDRALITEAARRNGITVTQPEIDQRYKEMIQYAENAMAKRRIESIPRSVIDDDIRMVLLAEKSMNITVSEKEARDFFTKNIGLFTRPAMAKLVCINTSERTKATEVYSRLKAGEDPKRLSELYSTADMLKKNKGEIGWILRSSMSPAVAEKIFDANNGQGLKIGEFTDPIETKTADPMDDNKAITEYVVFYIEDIQPPVVPKFDEVKDVASVYCRTSKYQAQASQWFTQQANTIGKEWKQVKDLYDPQSPLEAKPIPPSKYQKASSNNG